MKLPQGYGICLHCRRRYRVCRFNARHQDYCSRAECQQVRKRKRDRERYRQKYQAADGEFRTREKARRSEARRRKAKMAAVEPPPATAPPAADLACEVRRLSWVVAGVVRAFSGETDAGLIGELTSTFEAAGRRLSGDPGGDGTISGCHSRSLSL